MILEAVLTIAADLFVVGFTDMARDVYKRYTGDASKKALKIALSHAIENYAVGNRLAIAQPLVAENGLLTNPRIIDELRMIVSFQRAPNYLLIGDVWQRMVENPPNYIDFVYEANRFVSLLKDALRDTEAYRDVIESQDIQRIAEVSEDTATELHLIENHLQKLTRLFESQLIPMYQKFLYSQETIRKAIFQDFSHYISLKTSGFTGRSHVMQQVQTFLDNELHESGYFFLQGDPGIGKTAIMAQLVLQNGYVHHFNIRSEINRTEDFLKNICAQLIATYDLNYDSLPAHVSEDGTVFQNLLHEVSDVVSGQNSKCIIVIDALDEVNPKDLDTHTNPLHLPQTPPKGIYFIISRRRDNQPFVRVSDVSLASYTIQQDDELNQEDIKFFIQNRIRNERIQKYIARQHDVAPDEFIKILFSKSQGNFIYTRLVLDDIEQGKYNDRSFRELPQGLENYYQDHWQRMKALGEQEWVMAKLPVILALTVAREPINIEQISKYAGVEVEAPNKMKIRVVLEDFSQFIYIKELIYAKGNKTMKERQYRWYHASFFDFIEAKDEIEEGVSLARAKSREFETLQRQMKGLYGSKRNRKD